MFTLLLALAAPQGPVPSQTDPVPFVDGTKIKAGTVCYALTRNDAELGVMLQVIEPVEVDGVPAWDIVNHQRLSGGVFDLRDHFVVRRDDLTPIRFASIDAAKSRVSGKPHEVHLTYRSNGVIGYRLAGGETTGLQEDFPGKIWEGNLWGVTFGALPLAEDASFSLPIYHYDKGIGAFTLKVTGSDTVETPDGPVDVWLVDAGTSPDRRTVYLISKEDGSEVGTRAPHGYGSRLGGDCSTLD
jgi:hypothetical protein